MATTANNAFPEVTAGQVWHLLRSRFGSQLQAASLTLMFMSGDGKTKFEVFTVPAADDTPDVPEIGFGNMAGGE
jgi:hypothetical protein